VPIDQLICLSFYKKCGSTGLNCESEKMTKYKKIKKFALDGDLSQHRVNLEKFSSLYFI